MAKEYFKNAEVQALIETYLDVPADRRQTNQKAIALRQKILIEVSKIINGIIFTHKFTMWEAYDDLFQEAVEACIKALEKFNPNFITSSGAKATAFNYFSLTTKRCLKFYTIRNRKFRESLQIDEYAETIQDDTESHTFSSPGVSDNFINQLKKIFAAPKYKKIAPLIDIMKEYLDKIGNFNKRDFFRFCKAYGWSPNLIRKFIKIIKENKAEFYKV